MVSPFSSRCRKSAVLPCEVGGGQLLEIGLERGDVRGLLLQPLEPAALADAKDLLEVADLHGSRVAAYKADTLTSQKSARGCSRV